MKMSAGAPASICRASVDDAAKEKRILASRVSVLSLYCRASFSRAPVRLAAANTVIVSGSVAAVAADLMPHATSKQILTAKARDRYFMAACSPHSESGQCRRNAVAHDLPAWRMIPMTTVGRLIIMESEPAVFIAAP